MSLADIQAALERILELLQETGRTAAASPTPHHESPPILTERQVQVLRCAAAGVSIAETARRLHMSTSTVKNHRQQIFARLRVSNVPAAVYEATLRGLLP
jgi:DNA-binding NarL/FixJ family response regulator